MNIHPIFVHFPIALLSLYAVFELIRWRKVLVQPYWFYIKAVLVIVGFLTTFLALATGPEDQFRSQAALVEVHETFAILSTIVFGIIALIYVISWIENSGMKMHRSIIAVNAFLTKPALLIILSLIGLCLITMTGALGGAIAYGPEIDPVATFVYGLFF